MRLALILVLGIMGAIILQTNHNCGHDAACHQQEEAPQ